MKINTNEYAAFYGTYVNRALEHSDDLYKNLQFSLEEIFQVLSNISEEKQLFAYADKKWTIKEVLVHIIDTERIMAYRALRIARNDTIDLLGFDQDEFAANSNANDIPFIDLLKEFSLVRKSSIAMFKGFNQAMLQKRGKASGTEITVQALGFILSGHVLYHLDVIKERYL